MRALFVSNGHGEIAIAARIADFLPQQVDADHLALVGNIPTESSRLHDVGPRKTMPSGGLIAMGNARNIARDAKAGLVGLTLAQLRFLRSVRGVYDVAVAVGDTFALLMTLQARAKHTVFAGTAKSVYVAKYGPLERRVLARAAAVFVRDEATAADLCAHGIAAHAANVIADLPSEGGAELRAPYAPLIGVFPGSRASAYADAVRSARVMRLIAREKPGAGAALSIAPGIDARITADALKRDGWDVRTASDAAQPFEAFDGERSIITAWNGPLQAVLARATIVLGQAGTANEAAASAGVPVVAMEAAERPAWYRKRQIALLGSALMLAPADERECASAVLNLLHDDARRANMAREGRARMGEPGGAQRIAAFIMQSC